MQNTWQDAKGQRGEGAKGRSCKRAKKKQTKEAKVQKCKGAKRQRGKELKTQRCKDAKMQRYSFKKQRGKGQRGKDANMQRCKKAKGKKACQSQIGILCYIYSILENVKRLILIVRKKFINGIGTHGHKGNINIRTNFNKV